MHKHTLWITIAVIFMVAIFSYWLNHQNNSATQVNTELSTVIQTLNNSSSLLNSTNQLNIQTDCQFKLDRNNHLIINKQAKDCFEHFITQQSPSNTNQIQNMFKTYINQQYKEPVSSQILALWHRYLEYRIHLANLQLPVNQNISDTQFYHSIFTTIQTLQKHFFLTYEIEGLFDTEDTYHFYLLNRIDIMTNENLNELEKAKQLKELFNKLPYGWHEDLKQSNKLEALQKLTADIKEHGGDAKELRQMRLSLVGSEATQYLEILDTQKLNWKNRVNYYLTARDKIIQSKMDNIAKEIAIQSLQKQNFTTEKELRQLNTFEYLHDQNQQLKYSK